MPRVSQLLPDDVGLRKTVEAEPHSYLAATAPHKGKVSKVGS